jgi:hypothetical protein
MSLFTAIVDRIFIHLVKSTTVVNKLSSKLVNANNNLQASILIFIQDSSKSVNNNVLMLSRKPGLFLESSPLPWQGYTVSVIRSGLCSTGCCFTILTNLLENMRIVSRESTAISVQSFKKLLRNTLTVAIRSVALRGFDVLTVERKDC